MPHQKTFKNINKKRNPGCETSQLRSREALSPGEGAKTLLRTALPSLLRRGILKSHGNGQSGGSFGRSVRCGFVVSVVLYEFGYSPSPFKIDVTCQKKLKNVFFK